MEHGCAIVDGGHRLQGRLPAGRFLLGTQPERKGVLKDSGATHIVHTRHQRVCSVGGGGGGGGGRGRGGRGEAERPKVDPHVARAESRLTSGWEPVVEPVSAKEAQDEAARHLPYQSASARVGEP